MGRHIIAAHTYSSLRKRVIAWDPTTPNNPINARAPSLGPSLSLFSKVNYILTSPREPTPRWNRDAILENEKTLGTSCAFRAVFCAFFCGNICGNICGNRSFSLATKKWLENRPMEKAKKMKCYKRLKYKQYVQVAGLSGTQFLSYLPKCFTHLYSLLSKRFRASSSRKLGRELSIFFAPAPTFAL